MPSNDLTIAERLANELADNAVDLTAVPSSQTIPTPTADVSSLLTAVRAIKNALDQLTGTSGSVLDKALTTRDLLNEGFAAYSGSSGLVPASGGTVIVSAPAPAPPPDPGYQDPRPVLTTPPTPSNLEAWGAFKTIVLTWDLTDYRNHAYTEIWRNTVNNLGSAVLLNTTNANLYSDASGTLGATYYYWVRAVNIEGTQGAFNSAVGVSAGLLKIGSTDLSALAVEAANLAARIGGSNLVGNSSFESDGDANGLSDGWSATAQGTISGQSFSRVAGRMGGFAQRISTTTLGTTPSDRSGVYRNIATFTAGAVPKLTLSAWFRANAGSRGAVYVDMSAGAVYVSSAYNIAIATGSWQRVTHTFNVPSNVTDVTFYVWQEQNASVSASWIEFDDVQVEEGDYASEYFGKLAAQTIVAGDGAIANLAISNALIANAAVDAAKIADAAIGTAKIGDLQVTNAKIADATITNAKIVDLSATKITTGTLDAGRIAANSITADKIDSRSLTVKDANGNVLLGSGYTVGSGNLLKNSDFKTSSAGVPTGFSIYNNGAYSISSSVVVGGAAVGDANYWRLTPNVTVSNTFGFYLISAATAMGGMKQGIDYVLSFYARASSTGQIFEVRYNSTPEFQTFVENPALTSSWQRYVYLFKWTSVSPDANGVFVTVSPTSFPSGQTLDFANLQIETGRYPSGWSPPAVNSLNTISSSNISTYIAAGAIDNAYIGNFIQSTNFDGTINAGGTITNYGTTGWALGKGGQAALTDVTLRSSGGAGKRITINESSSNEAKFYGDRGDGTVEQLASIGISNVLGDNVIGYFGSAATNRIALLGYSGSSVGVYGYSNSGYGISAYTAAPDASHAALFARSDSNNGSPAVSAYVTANSPAISALAASSGNAITAQSYSGYGLAIVGANTTRGHIRLQPMAGRPSNPQDGDLAMIYISGGTTDNRTSNPRLCYYNAAIGQWLFVENSATHTG